MADAEPTPDATLPVLVRSRLEKLEILRQHGIDPYPPSWQVTASIEEVKERIDALAQTGERVRIASRLRAQRTMGRVVFLDLGPGLNDEHLQVMVRLAGLEESMRVQLDCADLGDWVGVEGICTRTKTGEPTVIAGDLQILCKTLYPLPNFKGRPVRDADLMAVHPELDLIFGQKKRVLRQRARILHALRTVLMARGLTEVETPYLNPYFGGADARPFTTRVWALGDDEVFLAVSPEIEDKRLIVGGMTEGVFTIARNFRNEGIDHSHNPEFSALEVYIPFCDVFDMMGLIEEIFVHCCKAVHGIAHSTFRGVTLSFEAPWPRISMLEAVQAATGLVVGELTQRALAKACRERRLHEGLPDLSTAPSATLIERLEAGLFRVPETGWGGLEREALEAQARTRHLHVGMDLERAWDFLVTGLFERYVEPDLIQPCHVILHPARTTVLCKGSRHGQLPNGEGLIERCESYAMGMELTNAYTELNDPLLQRQLIEGQIRERDAGSETAMPGNELFLRAIEWGLPPTGGLGIGIDRMVMLLLDAASIREVIAFPLVRRR